jgi:hydrogenase expression/formation protein HypC
MCLGIPMQVVSRNGLAARCEAKGQERDISLLLLQDEEIDPGDFVVVTAGHAIQKISEAEAFAAWELYDQMLASPAR